MEVGESAPARMPGEIVAQPLDLRGAGADRDARIQHDHMPCTSVVAVIPLSPPATCRTEIVVIGKRLGDMIVVIPSRWSRSGFVPTPCGCVAARELARASVRVRVITKREHDAVVLFEQSRGRTLAVFIAIG